MRALAIALSAVAAFATAADACTPFVYRDPGRYVGGDLAEQIARKANTIQIVRATERHLLSRTDLRTEDFYITGKWPVASGSEPLRAPGRHRDVYVYVFEVIETLKGGVFLRDSVERHLLRIMSEPLEEEPNSHIREVFDRPWIFPPSRLDVPGARLADRPPGAAIPDRDGPYAVLPLDYRPAGQGDHCFLIEFRLAVGETYVVLRNESGRPYFAEPEEPQGGLPIDAQVEDRPQARFTLNAPALVRIAGPDDSYLMRLRAALERTP